MWKKHHHRAVQIAYAATKEQLPHFINILQILPYNNGHVNILLTAFIEL